MSATSRASEVSRGVISRFNVTERLLGGVRAPRRQPQCATSDAFKMSANAFALARFASCASFVRVRASVASRERPRALATLAAAPHASLIQGASRGIGFELARQLLERDGELFSGRAAGGVVIATCRDPTNAEALNALAKKHGARLRVLRVDATDVSTIEAAAKIVESEFGRLDFLANVSAVLSDPARGMRPETSILRTEAEHMLAAYHTNAVGPAMMMKHFAPLMLKTATGNKKEGGNGGIPVIANWSARVSSIGDNALGGWHSYRASKTALNQLTRNAAIEFGKKKEPIIAMLVHPGTVDTKLSEPFKKNVPPEKLFTPEFAAGKLLDVIGAATMESSGSLFDYAGEKIAW